jgi:uncharacterized membrane protein YidH (DUF202 family)
MPAMSEADIFPPQARAARPARFAAQPVPPIPQVDPADATASTQYSYYRTAVSQHRTGLSEHRTDLSEYRSDLSGDRTEMSMRRTGMAIQRTRMSADRTLMSVQRTSLSLIGFGFTIYQAFEKLREAGVIHRAAAPRNFGLALILLGVLLLIGGIVRHIQFATELRAHRERMTEVGLIHGQTQYPVSISLIVAIAILCIGVLAIASIVFSHSLYD